MTTIETPQPRPAKGGFVLGVAVTLAVVAAGFGGLKLYEHQQIVSAEDAAYQARLDAGAAMLAARKAGLPPPVTAKTAHAKCLDAIDHANDATQSGDAYTANKAGTEMLRVCDY